MTGQLFMVNLKQYVGKQPCCISWYHPSNCLERQRKPYKIP